MCLIPARVLIHGGCIGSRVAGIHPGVRRRVRGVSARSAGRRAVDPLNVRVRVLDVRMGRHLSRREGDGFRSASLFNGVKFRLARVESD